MLVKFSDKMTHRITNDSVLYPEAKNAVFKALRYAYHFWQSGHVEVDIIGDRNIRLMIFDKQSDQWKHIQTVKDLVKFFEKWSAAFGDSFERLLNGNSIIHGGKKYTLITE